jgi:hypothetical protein
MSEQPVRVLYVLGSLDRGGAETWAMQLLQCLDRRRVQVDILVHRPGGAYEAQVRFCGADVLFCGNPHQLFTYAANLKRLLLEQKCYHVVHSHLQTYSGLVLRIAHQAGVPGRIAHARNSSDGQGVMLHRLAYRAVMRLWIKRHATHLFAVSSEAAEGTFWKEVVREGRCRILTGIDFSPFQAEVNRNQIRAELDIPDGMLVPPTKESRVSLEGRPRSPHASS